MARGKSAQDGFCLPTSAEADAASRQTRAHAKDDRCREARHPLNALSPYSIDFTAQSAPSEITNFSETELPAQELRPSFASLSSQSDRRPGLPFFLPFGPAAGAFALGAAASRAKRSAFSRSVFARTAAASVS